MSDAIAMLRVAARAYKLYGKNMAASALNDAADELARLRELEVEALVREWRKARKASILSTTVDAKGNPINYQDIIDRLADAEHRLNAWGKE